MVVVDQTGAVVKDAKVSVVNTATGAVARGDVRRRRHRRRLPALSLTGDYKVNVTKDGFHGETSRRPRRCARARRRPSRSSSSRRGGKSEVTVYGTTEGVRADPQIGRRLDSATIDETPILGRKVTTLPLFNSAFRQGKGTGDLFVNATYFVTGRRQPPHDDVHARRREQRRRLGPPDDARHRAGRRGAGSRRCSRTRSPPSSAGPSGPAMNIVTKSGTNALHGEGALHGPAGQLAGEVVLDRRASARRRSRRCVDAGALTSITPVDIPDELIRSRDRSAAPIVKDKTFFFAAADYTRQDRTTALSPTLPSFVLDNGSLTYVGEYRQELVNARVDHKLTPNQTLMFRFNFDHFYDTNPNDAVIGTTAPTAARRYTRGGWSVAGQPHVGPELEHR